MLILCAFCACPKIMSGEAPSSAEQGTGGTYYGPGRKFEPYNYDEDMMHHVSGNSDSNCAVTDYTDLTNVQECDLVGPRSQAQPVDCRAAV